MKIINIILTGLLLYTVLYIQTKSDLKQEIIVEQSGFNWNDPESKFSTSKNFTSRSTITWKAVKNIQETCERESRARGLGGFGYGVQACSFWTGSTCTIFTERMASIHNLGHEVLHCFQGKYH